MTKRPLPPGLVALATELGEALWELARDLPNTSLAALALGVLAVVQRFLPRLLAQVILANPTQRVPGWTRPRPRVR